MLTILTSSFGGSYSSSLAASPADGALVEPAPGACANIPTIIKER